jgi:5-bromo-4-chloroindolyl phosphate hydrolysis protein
VSAFSRTECPKSQEYADSNKDHHKQISKDVQESTIKLNDLGEKITKSFKSVEKEVKDLLDEYKFLSSETEKLVNKIDKVDFPTRLDKLDATVSSISQGLQNTQTRIGDLERNIKDDLQAKTKDIISKVDSTESNLKQRIENFEKVTATQFEKQSKENKLLKILLFVSIGLIVGLIVFSVISGN